MWLCHGPTIFGDHDLPQRRTGKAGVLITWCAHQWSSVGVGREHNNLGSRWKYLMLGLILR
jgi:hypothetical protein